MYPTNVSPLMIKISRGQMTKKKALSMQYVKNGKNAHKYQNLQFAITLSDYITERKSE